MKHNDEDCLSGKHGEACKAVTRDSLKKENQLLLCPSCRRGRHRYHQYDFLFEGRVTLCKCPPCVEFVKSIGKREKDAEDRKETV